MCIRDRYIDAPGCYCVIISRCVCWSLVFVTSCAVRLLLENGADTNQKDSIGNTPLHLGQKVTSGYEAAYLIENPAFSERRSAGFSIKYSAPYHICSLIFKKKQPITLHWLGTYVKAYVNVQKINFAYCHVQYPFSKLKCVSPVACFLCLLSEGDSS